MKKVHVVSLGCPKARVDTEVMVGLLQREGCTLVADPAAAEVIVVNTCGFLQTAAQESVDTILELAQHKQQGNCRRLIVTGCLVQRYAGEIEPELPEVDTFLGTGSFQRIAAAVNGTLRRRSYIRSGSFLYDEEMPRTNTVRGATAYVKVAEGCSRSCSFCIIPKIRGRQRSRPLDSVVAEARRLAATGVAEIILVAQDLTSYGTDIGLGRDGLGDLVDALESVDGLHWVRLLYLYPWNVSERLISALGRGGKLLPYVDMPLQHINDRVLKAMRRNVLRGEQERLIAALRRGVPDLTLRTTFIAGFPGETEQEFGELLSWVQEASFDRVGVFPYSPEEGTPAHELPDQVPEEIRQERANLLMAAQQPIALRRNEALLGRELEVLVDGVSEEHEYVLEARHKGQAPEIDGCVYLSFDEYGEPVEAGQRARVLIEEATPYDLRGVVMEAVVGR
ncbi:MAG: 30S ribosomal protein S12 methylthiotransferase RimO [Candidatus Schekmanbacteria bacterium]|nr:30S ribosomal protein S12 methylthiotransferase RimO [Candidatus Schekmanbacteria bacterium]